MGCLLLALELHAHVLDNRKYIFHCVVVCYMTLVHVVLIESKLFTCPAESGTENEQFCNGFQLHDLYKLYLYGSLQVIV